MDPLDPTSLRNLLEAIIASFSVLGGGMAYLSGSYAAAALAQKQPAGVVARRVNEGIGVGFTLSRRVAVVALAIMALT